MRAAIRIWGTFMFSKSDQWSMLLASLVVTPFEYDTAGWGRKPGCYRSALRVLVTRMAYLCVFVKTKHNSRKAARSRSLHKKPKGVSGFGDSFESQKQRTCLWPKALRLRTCICCCLVHRLSRRNVCTTNSESARRCGDTLLAISGGKTPKGGRTQDIGSCLEGPSYPLWLQRVDFGQRVEVGFGVTIQF